MVTGNSISTNLAPCTSDTIDTFVSGKKKKVKIKENIVTAAMIESVPGALRAGEASSMGNNCTGMNAPSHNAQEVIETATPVNVILLCRVV